MFPIDEEVCVDFLVGILGQLVEDLRLKRL
jgi:hypothetical protein